MQVTVRCFVKRITVQKEIDNSKEITHGNTQLYKRSDGTKIMMTHEKYLTFVEGLLPEIKKQYIYDYCDFEPELED